MSFDTNKAEYGGVGGITSIDSALWMFIATWRYCDHTGIGRCSTSTPARLQRTIDWLSALDANNCGMLEIPEAGDWTDLFARSYNVLYDEVLWFRSLIYYAKMLRNILGDDDNADIM